MKCKIIILLSCFLFSFNGISQTNSYERGLKIILESNEYCSIEKSKKRYHVSSELLIYNRLGSYFTKELKEYNKPLSDEEIVIEDNLRDDDLLKLNIKKRFKVQINFSEEKEGIFFAELLETKRRRKYDEIYFGVSYIYMFKRDKNNSIKLIKVTKLDNN